MESNTPGQSGDPSSTPNLEGELTKEKLAAKCKNLLTIAQKAKLARDDAILEKEELQKTLEKTSLLLRNKEQQLNTAEEMLAALTSQKLKLAMDIEDYKNVKARSTQELSSVIELKERAETEAESYKRQYKRIEEENDELILKLQEKEKREAELLNDIRKLHENNESVKIISNNIGQEKVELEQSARSLKSEVNKLLTEKKLFDQLLKEKYQLSYSNVDELDGILDVKLRENGQNDSVDRDDEVLELKDRIQKLVAELEVVNADRDKTMANLEEVRIETKQLIDNSEKLMEDIEILKSEKDKIEDALNSSVREKTEELQRLNEVLNAYEHQIGGLREELKNWKKDNSLLDVFKDENTRMKEELDGLLHTNLDLKNKLNKLNNSMNSFSKNLLGLFNRDLAALPFFEDFKKRLECRENLNGCELLDLVFEKLGHCATALTEKEKLIIKLTESVEDIQKRAATFESLSTSYQELLATHDASSSEINNLRKIIAEHELRQEDLLGKLTDLQSQYKDACAQQDDIRHKEFELSSLRTALDQRTSELDSLKSTMEVLAFELNELKISKSDLENDLSKITDKEQEKSSKLKQAIESITEAERRIAEKELEINQVSLDLRKSADKINDIEKTLENALSEKSKIASLYEEIVKKNTEIMNELERTTNENEKLISLLKGEEEKIQELTSTVNELTEETQRKEKDLEGRRKEIGKLTLDLDETKRQLDCLTENEDVKSQLELKVKEIAALSQEKNFLSSKIDEKDSLISELTQKLNSISVKNEKELKNMEASMKDELAKLKSIFEEKNLKIESLTMDLQESQNKCASLERTRQELDCSLEQMKLSLGDSLKVNSDEIKSQAEIISGLRGELESVKELMNFKALELEEINRIWAGRLNSYKVPLIGLKKISLELAQQYDYFRLEFISVLTRLRESVNDSIGRLIDNTKKELLDEMHHMNEVLKERGSTISKLQDLMSELQSKFESEISKNEDLKKEIASYEETVKRRDDQLFSKDGQLKELESEICRLREMKDNSADTDVLSTSTISRSEEHTRLKEVDESIDEKYVKLRQIAVKLKKRNVELNQALENERAKFNSERTELVDKVQNLTVVAKNTQRVQESYDRLFDDFEAVKAKNSELSSVIKGLADNEESLKLQASALLSDSQKIPSLKKQIDSLNTNIKDLKFEIQKCKSEKESEAVKSNELSKQCKQLENEVRTLKQSLEQAVQQGRSSNVLELELQNYKKVIEDLNVQITIERSKLSALEKENSSSKFVQSGLEEQITMLEGQIKVEEDRSNDLRAQLRTSKEEFEKNISQSEEMKKHVAELRKELMASRSKCDQLAVEMSSLSSDFSKKEIQMQDEITSLKSHLQATEAQLRISDQEITSLKSEIDHLRKEFESYRLRAQNTLAKRKGDSMSPGEKEAKEQVEKLQKELSIAQVKLEASLAEIETLNSRLSSVQLEKSRSDKRSDELKKALQQKVADIDKLNAEFKAFKLLSDSSLQSLKSEWNEKEFTLKSEVEALNDIITKLNYRLEEKEHEIKNGLDTQQSTLSYFDENMLQEREDAEGSESEPAPVIARRLSNVVPLDVLLNSPIDDENKLPILLDKLEKSQDEIRSYEARTKHLTSLLSEAEKDAARSLHQNAILKEELRRLERSLERQPHMANSEYLKNVVFKFLTLQSGDEKSRLVPVLDTILKFSPEETSKLQAVARGDASWGSYLHSWTGL